MLAQNMVTDTRNNLERPQALKAAIDPKILSDASHFVLRDGRAFVDRLLTFYGDYLERAMQTMYTDLRTGLHNMSADRLSLIDDDTINRQIEVDRLVLRMRDADHENLGRLNIIIAQLHGDHDVRERENPFRPYLLARSLHEVLANMVKNEAVAKALFEAFSNVLVARLPDFYTGIREVFESNGVRSRLLARPANLTRRQRELLAQRDANAGFSIAPVAEEPVEISIQQSLEAETRIKSGLQRMFQTQMSETNRAFRPGGEAPAAPESTEGRALAFQDFVWQMFNQKRPAPLPRGTGNTSANQAQDKEPAPSPFNALSPALALQLNRMQKESLHAAAAGERHRPAGLRERIDHEKLTAAERITVDVVGLLFEYILQDEHIPAKLRGEIGRLQAPFLKAAMLTPELLRQPAHPARLLLNRLGSIASAVDLSLAFDQRIAAEIAATVDRILERFEDDMAVFTACLEEFEEFLRRQYRKSDAATASRIDAIEEAERTSVMRFSVTNTLRDLLPALEIDRRVSDVIMHTWVRVLATFLARAPEDNTLINQYRGVLPELAWSVQPKYSSQDRNALMKLLPDLVKRVKKGLELARVSEEESKKALDQLADVHMQILRATPRPAANKGMTLEELYQHFSLLQICEGSYLWAENEPLTVQGDTVQAALASRDVAAELHIQTEAIPALATDEDWMAQMRLGIGAEVQVGETVELARLAWVSEQRSLFMFAVERSGQTLVYSSISLLKALRDGIFRPYEYAPLFDRAVESLMEGAESLQAAA